MRGIFALFLILVLSGCMGSVPQNQAIIQDVANDVGAVPSSDLLGAARGSHSSASAEKSKAFWGNR